MFASIRSRLSFSNVVAVAALLLATGGVSYAASTLAPGSVGTPQLQGRSVTAKKLADRSVTAGPFSASPAGPAGVSSGAIIVSRPNGYFSRRSRSSSRTR